MYLLPASSGFTLSNSEGLPEALAILREGGIVAHATETCYGFACDVTSLGAVCNLFALKNRPYNSPVSILFPSLEEAKKYVEWNDAAEMLAAKYLPGPLTLILPIRKGAPFRLSSIPLPPPPMEEVEKGRGGIGLRISSHPLAQRLVTEFGKPLSTTSANLHCFPSCYSAQDILAQFRDQPIQPDLILDSGELPRTPPSTVMDLTAGKTVKRKGAV